MYRYNEPNHIDEAQNREKKFPQFDIQRFDLMFRTRYTANRFFTVHVENLHYRSCIKITGETIFKDEKGKIDFRTTSFVFAERQTLRYF